MPSNCRIILWGISIPSGETTIFHYTMKTTNTAIDSVLQENTDVTLNKWLVFVLYVVAQITSCIEGFSFSSIYVR